MATGDLVSSYPAQGGARGNGRAIAISPDDLSQFLTSRGGQEQPAIFQVSNQESNRGTILNEFITPFLYGALTYDSIDQVFWGGRYDGSFKIDKLDPSNFTILDTIDYSGIVDQAESPNPGSCDGLAVDPCSNTLFFGQDLGTSVYNITKTGTPINRFSTPFARPRSGIASDGTNLWLALPSEQNLFITDIYQVDTAGDVITSFTINAGVEGVVVDMKTFTPKCVIWTNEIAALSDHLIQAWEIPCANNNVNVSQDSHDQNEPSIAVNPQDPNKIFVTANDFGLGGPNPSIGLFRSDNGGTSFKENLLPLNLPPGLRNGADGIVASGFGNQFYVSGLANNGFDSKGNLIDGTIVFYRLEENGAKVIGPIIVADPKNSPLYTNDKTVTNDKPFLAVDKFIASPLVACRNVGNVYISYTQFSEWIDVNNHKSRIFLQRSNDSGNTWSDPVPLSNENDKAHGSSIAIGENGEVYVGWISSEKGEFQLVSSNDFGKNFSTIVKVSDVNFVMDPLTLVPGTTFRSSNFAYLATNLQTGFSFGDVNVPPTSALGDVYAVWNDSRNGPSNILLSRSRAHGQDGSWEFPIRVDNSPTGTANFFPAIAVSPINGTVCVIYYTNRVSSSFLDVYLAQAKTNDPNLIFDPSCRIIDNSFDPNTRADSDIIGDYISNTVDDNGKILSVWTDTRTFNEDIFFDRRKSK